MPEQELPEVLENWREQFKALFSNLPIGISYLTPDMRYIRINPFLEEKLGFKSEEIKGRHCYDIHGMYKDDTLRKGEEKICDICGVKAALDTGKPVKFTVKLRDDFIVENIAVPLRSNGRIIGVAKIVVDATERIGLEERLKKQAVDLEKTVAEKTKEQEEFMAMVTHDLKTPLTAIIGYSSIILSGNLGPIEENHRQPMEGILVNAQKMLGLVRNILSAGRIKEQKISLNSMPMHIESLIAETLKDMAPQINDKGQSASMEVEPDIPPVLADKEYMERALCNLITNAVKFTPYGGHLYFAVKKSGTHVEVSLTDTGTGIPEDELPMIFEKYYQGRGTNQSRGNGLGLFITKTIITAHGGTISADNTEGRGAIFSFRIPAAPSATGESSYG